MTFGGQSFTQYRPTRSLERHLSVSLGLRTLFESGTLMYTSGEVDYSILEIKRGRLRYRFNFGSGEGLVALDGKQINDGDWHQINLERHGNSAKITVDSAYEAQGSAPGMNDVLTLTSKKNKNEGPMVFFGAAVMSANDVRKGYHGCMDDVRLDGIPLPVLAADEDKRTSKKGKAIAELIKMTGISFKCEDRGLERPGVCGSQPCNNGGTCIELPDGLYNCKCPPRFQGPTCDYDLDPCASSPCLHGAACVNLKNDFHCNCPDKLSGKRCNYGKYCNPNPCQNGGLCEEGDDGQICQCRGFTGDLCTVDINECLRGNPCHNGGTCINRKGGFECVCPPGTQGPYCHTYGHIPRRSSSGGGSSGGRDERRDYHFKLEEIVGIIASLFGIVLIVLLWVMCRKFRVVKAARNGGSHQNANGNMAGSYHIQNEFDKAESIPMTNVRHPEGVYNNSREVKMNNLTRPLISPPHANREQQDPAFAYVDTVRSYGSAADELESLPPPQRLNQEYIQSIQKPMAAIAPSVINHPPQHLQHSDVASTSTGGDYCVVGGATAMQQQQDLHMGRNLLNFYPSKGKMNNTDVVVPRSMAAAGGAASTQPRPTSFKPMKVNMPPTDSPCLKGATSLSSLPTSNAEDTPKYFWDSFDLNNGEGEDNGGQERPKMTSEVAANPSDNASFVSASDAGSNERTRLLPQPGDLASNPAMVDPTRDIETLPEDDKPASAKGGSKSNDNVSNAGTEDEPPLGTVFPAPVSTRYDRKIFS